MSPRGNNPSEGLLPYCSGATSMRQPEIEYTEELKRLYRCEMMQEAA
jgi:hypothetical protein